MRKYYFRSTLPVFLCLLITACNNNESAVVEQKRDQPPSFAEARKSFTTTLIKQTGAKGKVEPPPPALFSIVQYPSAIGNMAAYLSKIPDDGKLHPAMIWITGGFGNDIGDVWTPNGEENDQSAGVIREAGIIMMYPSQRGGNTNPGADETCFGEIDDIMAAARFLAKQKGVDPDHIYLGGHSTGGTKVLLTAECSRQFRAVFSFGAADAVEGYGEEYLTFDTKNEKEFQLREPLRWLSSIQTPVFIFEGSGGNSDALKTLERRAKKEDNPFTHFYEIKGKDHFSVLQPVSRIIAQKVIADSIGKESRIDFGDELKSLE